MRTSDRYLAVHNLGLLQRQAGVDPAVAELVTAYARLVVDSGEPLSFDPRPFPPGSKEEARFVDLQARNPEADARFLAFLADYSARMARRRVVPVVDRDDLARRLGYSSKGLSAVLVNKDTSYREIRLPRKNGTHRVIHAPMEPVRGVQRWIFRRILAAYRGHDAAHGFVRGRSVLTNASEHVGRSVLVMMDLADFFPSIPFSRVRKAFERLGYPYGVAVALANLCTLKGRLPQGAPTSPAISNVVCERLDARLSGLAESRGFSYTRYADDLAFSSDASKLPSIIPFVRQIIEDEGFTVRSEKTRITRQGARQVVTGVVVNQRPNLQRAHVRKLRAAAHRLATRGTCELHAVSRPADQHDPVNVLRGHVAFLTMINRKRGSALAQIIRTATGMPEGGEN